MSEATELLTTAEVAERLGVTAPTIHRAVKLGRLRPAYRLAGVFLFSPAELDHYLQRRAKMEAEIEEARARFNTAP